jgi:hypothetical protein
MTSLRLIDLLMLDAGATAASSSPTVGAHALIALNGTTSPVNTQPTGSTFFVLIVEATKQDAVPTDNKGNTYTKVTPTIVNSGESFAGTLWWCQNGSGGSGHTWTLSSTEGFPALLAVEVVGAVTSGAVDAVAGQSINGGPPWASPSITSTVANDILLGFVAYDESSGGNAATASSPFTLIDSIAASSSFGVAASYYIPGTTTTTAAEFSSTDGSFAIVYTVAVKPP